MPQDVTQIKVRYFDDPLEVETLHESNPQPVKEPLGWFDRMVNSIKDAGNWTWGFIQGDFNENPTMGQIVSNAIITAIPVVDQVADARDIVAITKNLVWDKRYSEIAIWFALVVTLIGLIPTFGSLLKGVFKALWKGAKLDVLLKIFNYFRKGNGIKWLKQLRDGKLMEYIDEAIISARKVCDAVISKLNELKSRAPEFTHEKIDELLATLNKIKGLIREKFTEIGQKLTSRLKKEIDEVEDEFVSSGTRGGNVKNQKMVEPDNSPYNGGGKNTPIRNPKFKGDLDEKWFKDNGELDWPKNDGFIGNPQRQTLKEGEVIDRFSSKVGTKDRGNFLSPANTPYSDRALPYDVTKIKHAKYEVVKEFDVNSGNAAPWFGEKGGGVQYKTDMSVRDLIKQGFLREVK